MKRIVWTLLAVVIAISACGPKEDPTPQGDTLTLSPATMSFTADDSSTKFISVTATGDWTASASDTWISISTTSGRGNGSVSVTVSANEGEKRSGSVKFVSGQSSEFVSITQSGSGGTPIVPSPAKFDGNKRASTTYQLLIYSFADSDGDGIGDFIGIKNRLDYLDALGVTGIWLSPAHPADSYHGYSVQDYFSLNPDYASGQPKTAERAEEDFRTLLSAAHEKGIEIYMDYVLNHSGSGNPWFKEALANASSPYRDYYFISSNPSAEYKNFPMLSGTSYQSGEWKASSSGSPRITITSTTEDVTNGTDNWNLYMWDGSGDKTVKFVNKGGGNYYLVMDIVGEWGILVRKKPDWSSGSKFGAKGGKTTLQLGTPIDLEPEGADMSFTGNGRYKIELTNTDIQTVYYMGAFDGSMPDLNYGAIADVENNACFQDLAASADKWINMGVDGFRLDAVKHICGGIGSYNNAANRKFLKKWYDHCNATFKSAGHSGNIFMVGEVWDTSHSSEEKYYYEGITSCFEFAYWPLLYRVLTSGSAASYVTSVMGYINDHKAIRPDAQTSFFLTNHDHSSRTGDGEVRAADDLGKDLAKEKQAAAMLLTTPEKPFIYQGEELGYWGNSKGKGDEYIRAPIVWDAAAKQIAKKGVNDKVDTQMLTGKISVETQSADENSLLNVYKSFSQLRNTYPALAVGEMSAASVSGSSMAAWYMTSGSQKLLVIHNVATSQKQATVSDDMSHPIALLGTASFNETTLTLGPNSSVVFEL